jgi:hypothetical protein
MIKIGGSTELKILLGILLSISDFGWQMSKLIQIFLMQNLWWLF